MNTAMYSHPFTAKHLSILREELGYLVVDPVEKMLACGDIGIGGMAEVPSIVNAVVGVLEKVELNGVDGVEDGLGNGLLGTVEQVGNGTV